MYLPSGALTQVWVDHATAGAWGRGGNASVRGADQHTPLNYPRYKNVLVNSLYLMFACAL